MGMVKFPKKNNPVTHAKSRDLEEVEPDRLLYRTYEPLLARLFARALWENAPIPSRGCFSV